MSFFVPVTLGLMSLIGPLFDPPAAPSPRTLQLVGFGLVVGLDGTGGRSSFTRQVVDDMTVRVFGSHVGRMRKIVDRRLYDRLGPCPRPQGVQATGILCPTNCSAVMVTAVLPPATKKGDKVLLTVSSMDDATSLRGGLLMITSLKGVDGEVYATGQGTLSVGPTDTEACTAKIRDGGLVEVQVPGEGRSVLMPLLLRRNTGESR